MSEFMKQLNKDIEKCNLAYKIKDSDGNVFVFGGIEGGFPFYRGLGGRNIITSLQGYNIVEQFYIEG